jgi:peptidoglycan/LPS O-acetylase OafA/YrhL
LLGASLLQKPIYFRASLGQNLVLFSIMFLVGRGFYSGTFYPPEQCLVLALFIAPLLYSLTNPLKRAAPTSAAVSWVIVGLLYLLAAGMMLSRTPNAGPYPYWAVNYFWLSVPPITALLVLISPFLGVMKIVASDAWHPMALFMGRISYALYVVHMPICSLIHYKTYSVPLRIGLSIGLTFLLAWLFEYRLHPYLCRKFDRIWPDRPHKRDASSSRAQTSAICKS